MHGNRFFFQIFQVFIEVGLKLPFIRGQEMASPESSVTQVSAVFSYFNFQKRQRLEIHEGQKIPRCFRNG